MFYEAKNDLGADVLKIERGIDFSFPSHLHGSFELITVTEGSLTVTVDKKDYLLERGKLVLIFPNQVHEFKCHGSCSHYLCIFSPKLVSAYSKRYSSKLPENNLFTADKQYIDAFLDLNPDDPIFKVKGVLYSLCAVFDKSATYNEHSFEKDELLPIIFKFVEDSFASDCSLSALSRATSYNYEYLSKYFKERTGTTFTDYVNRFRINEACYIFQNSDYSILQTALDCGFDSLRSFNRNFKKILGITPSEYKLAYIS